MFTKVSYSTFLRACKQLTQLEDDQIKKTYDNLVSPLRIHNETSGYKFFLPYDVILNPGVPTPLVSGFRADMGSVFATVQTGGNNRSLKDNTTQTTIDKAQVFLCLYPLDSLIMRNIIYLNPCKIIDQAACHNPRTEGLIVEQIVSMQPQPMKLPAGIPFCQGVIQPYFTMAIHEENPHKSFDTHMDDAVMMH